MTATQVFYRFLKEELTIDGYLYFTRIIKGENVGYWRKKAVRRTLKPKWNKTFVEEFIGSGSGRNLSGFMSNLLKLEQSLVYNMNSNKDYRQREVKINPWAKYTQLVYKDTYIRLWRDFIKNNIENGEKRIYNGKIPEYRLKEK